MKEFSEGNVGYNLSHKVRFLMTTRCVVFTLTVRPLRDGLCLPPSSLPTPHHFQAAAVICSCPPVPMDIPA